VVFAGIVGSVLVDVVGRFESVEVIYTMSRTTRPTGHLQVGAERKGGERAYYAFWRDEHGVRAAKCLGPAHVRDSGRGPLDLTVAPNGHIVVASEFPFGAPDAVTSAREYDAATGELVRVFAAVQLPATGRAEESIQMRWEEGSHDLLDFA
jgi:hypothetical protein